MWVEPELPHRDECALIIGYGSFTRALINMGLSFRVNGKLTLHYHEMIVRLAYYGAVYRLFPPSTPPRHKRDCLKIWSENTVE